jgi:predicted transposase YdaD
MPHVTLFEELSREEGRQEGCQEGRQEGRQRSILELLETRFGEVPVAIRDRVRAIHDEAQLQEMLCRAVRIPGLDEF